MTLIHWSPNLSVGVEEIDSDHARLIELLNDLATDAEAGSGYDALRTRLDKLLAETERHFRHEEQIMIREEYPDFEYHRRIHEALMQEMAEFREELERGTRIGTEVTEFIRNWLVSHIMESDKHLGGYLEGRAAAKSGPAETG